MSAIGVRLNETAKNWRVKLNPCRNLEASQILFEPVDGGLSMTPVIVVLEISLGLLCRLEHETGGVRTPNSQHHEQLIALVSIHKGKVRPEEHVPRIHPKRSLTSAKSAALSSSSSLDFASPVPILRFTESMKSIS
ncbi:MAG: hypothetical protein IPH43_06310 [Xanthomonadales bacterium]|nr:hypothetical protein [Xanthomonadales bacterium]